MADFIAALKRFVNVEYDAQARQTYEIWKKPLPVRVAEGEAIADVEVIRVTDDAAWLRCRENLSKFRPGDNLRLSRGDPTAPGAVPCVLERERDTELMITPGYDQDFRQLSIGKGWALDWDIVDVRHLLLGALDTLAFVPEWQSYILSLFRGVLKPKWDAGRERQARQLASQRRLNESQIEAFARAYATESFYLIQGPPGTGKTWVLAYLAEALAREGQRVLVTAFTHRAINNALRKIVQATGYPHVFKVGQRQYADDLTWDGGQVPNYETFAASPHKPNDAGLIIGGTCFAVRTTRLRDVQFDTVIFDEAGQVTLPIAISGMLSGRRYIFIGDHKQMGPVIVGEHPEEWVTRSVFETLFIHSPGTMLDITYRMNEEINEFPSKHFYGGRLRPSESARKRRLLLKRRPQRYAEILDPERPNIFVEIPHVNRGIRSPEEAEVAAGLAAEAIACGTPPQEIAIVAPYRAQGRLIRQRLQAMIGSGGPDSLEGIVVDTVERIQGQEREMVIVSLTTSDPGHASQQADFYFQPNRLNVSITRPKTKRIVIGSPLLFRAQPKEEKHRAWVEYFRALYRESTVVRLKPASK
jgi:DNA replication ATP-dependent helicase Dna2